MVVLCPFRCNQEIMSKQTSMGVHLRCSGCQYRVTIPQFKMDRTSLLRKHALVAVRFLQGQYPMSSGMNPLKMTKMMKRTGYPRQQHPRQPYPFPK
jgi:hypothetical protein